jgi:hypothetical protein
MGTLIPPLVPDRFVLYRSHHDESVENNGGGEGFKACSRFVRQGWTLSIRGDGLKIRNTVTMFSESNFTQ